MKALYRNNLTLKYLLYKETMHCITMVATNTQNESTVIKRRYKDGKYTHKKEIRILQSFKGLTAVGVHIAAWC